MYRPPTRVSATIAVMLLASAPVPSSTAPKRAKVCKPAPQQRFLCVQEQCKVIDKPKAQTSTPTTDNRTLALLHSKIRKPATPQRKLTHPVYRGERRQFIRPIYKGERVHFMLVAGRSSR